MVSNLLVSRTKRFAETLELRGFRQVNSLSFERPLDGFSQGVAFAKGTGSLAGKFTLDIYWRYTHSSYPSEGMMDYCQRIGIFDSGRDEWFQISDERGWAKVGELFVEHVEPFFQRHSSIRNIIESYEKQLISPAVLFGIDKGWQAFNIGHCYSWIGRNGAAVKYLREIVDQYSQQPFDWIQKRKGVALASLSKIE
jgi:hypothetical protein